MSTLFSSSPRVRALLTRKRRFISYGVAALIPAIGLVGAARADAPEPDAGFAPIEISSQVEAALTAAPVQDIDAVFGDAENEAAATLEPAAPIEQALEELDGGKASYYGPNLAGNRTANGERFDPTQLTAAHRTLPMGSKVKVTNKRNGKSVIVRINDRGPFHGQRVIDLSTAAAREIGMVATGTATVGLALLTK